MIKRYSREELEKIWSDENRFRIWLEIEILACEARAKAGEIPENVVKNIREKANFNVEKILEIEAEVKHDVIAFLTNVAEFVGEDSVHIHYGMTSSDVLDTALAVQMKQSGEIILQDIEKFIEVLRKRAIEFKNTPCIGRSHGIHAEPTSFGLKFALWCEEMRRNKKRLENALENASVGQISGAVGTFEHLEPYVQNYVCEKLGLKAETVSTQVVQRDRHAEFLVALALIGTTLDKIAVEIRHLQRTEVSEAEEFFSKGQKGSSAMPHKRNPIVSEQISGLARILRTNALAGMENVALWHERDISHSSVERIILPDSTILTNYLLNKSISLVANLLVYPENMLKNINLTNGLVFSQTVLLALTKKGCLREIAYRLVQKNAMEVWKTKENFKEVLKKDSEIRVYLSVEELESCFDLKKSLKHVDYIFTVAKIE
ncbi:adenylosuccinate lyase [bacterium]|nr:adenylosuccinate lyase [bacterium]